MGVIRKFNPETGQWEVYGSTEAKDINLIDVGDNFEDKNVEGALREISDKLNETLANLDAQKNTLIEHSSDIEWLKENGGGGGGTGGVSAPTITSTFESCVIDKETEINIPIFFTSPNLGEGTAYLIINNVEVAAIPGIKQGNNTIEVGKLTDLKNEISIYVKDRTGMLSNQLYWTVTAGGIDLTIDFDDTADYYISDMITMQYYVQATSGNPTKMYLTIDYDNYEIDCKNGFNEYIFPQLGIGIHKVVLYVSDGNYTTQTYNFNVVVVNSNSLYVSSTFQGGEFEIGNPVSIQYRVSKASNEAFNVKLYLNDKLTKELSCVPGAYYWTLNDLDIGDYTARIEVSGAYDEPKSIELIFNVISSGYQPIKITEDGLIYRLCAKGRTNQDVDKANPIDDSGNGVKTTLHGFNFFSNGWIDGELVCDGDAYVEIDAFPYQENALYGSTIEIQYTALDIGFDDARILDYTDIETPYKGIFVDIGEASMISMNNTGTVHVDRDTETTVSFVIDRKNKFAKMYIDGICSRAFTLMDTGSGTAAIREDFTHAQKIYLNGKKGVENSGACKIKDFRIYNRVLSDDEIVSNFVAQISNLKEQEKRYNFEFNNSTLPVIRMYGDMTNMTLETPVTMRIKYTSPNEDEFGQSFDLPYCQVNWQGTSSLQYVLKNFTARLKDENLAPYEYSPYPNGVKEDVYCFKCDYMESTHSRNVGIAKFVNSCLYDAKNPKQMEDPNIRNSINGFPCIMYINDELQGVYNFNLDRYSTKSFGYTDPDNVLVYEISANSDTTAGAFYSWTESSGKSEEAYYKSDFECLYPPTRAAGNDNLSELKRLIEWVDKSSDEDFKDNIGRYFNLEYLLRYYLNVLVFGLVDSLGKNAKITSFDSGLTWYFQFYDADTSIGLNNSGFLLFESDIEMGDENTFNTTGSRLWQRVVYLFQNELKEQYALMRQDRFTVDNIMKYLYGEQISRIPATYYNKDMQAKYLNFGSSYLYALHGNSEHQIRKWVRERIMYVDTLLGYMVTSSDYITIRANKLGEVYFDVEMYQPMYVSVKFRDEAENAGMITKRVGRGEKVRFSYNLPTATDQEILVYCGKNIKSLGNLSNMAPSTILIANANRLTEIEVHSPNLINTDLSECKLLQRIDISDCTALGTGVGAQPILNVQNCKYLKYLNCRNTQLTSIYTMQTGSNLEEIYYPDSIQSIQLTNQAYLKIVGIPYETDEYGQVTRYCKNLADIEINNCRYIDYIHYPYKEGDYVNLDAIKQVQNFTLITSLDRLTGMNFRGFNKLKNLKLSSMHNISSLGFDDMLLANDVASLENITVSDCPLIDTVSFNLSSVGYKVDFVEGAVIDLGGVQSIKTIESNASIKGLKTIIIPTSTENIKFTAEYGDGVNDVRNIWSAASEHTLDGFEGIDLLDIELKHLNMARLGRIENGINFNIAPTDQHPNMNVYRTSNYFKPEGTVDLTNYTGYMRGMFKGVDLSKLEVIIDTNKNQTDLTGLFEGAIIPETEIDKVNMILDKFALSTDWSNLFKNANLGFNPDDIRIPDVDSFRLMNLSGMYYGTNVSKDIVITNNVVNVMEMFKNCKFMESYVNNWENYYSDLLTDDCYSGTGGNTELIPVPWGGYGFFPNVTSEIIVRIPKSGYELVLANKYKTTSFGIVKWGDGEVSYLDNTKYAHTFEQAGVYTIKGHFTFGGGYVNNTSLSSALIEVKQIAGDTTDLDQAFRYCTILNKVNMNGLKPVKLSDTFNSCSSLNNVVIDELDCTNVTTTSNMFNSCVSLSTFNMNNLTFENLNIMKYMFNGCTGLTNLGIKINTSEVTDMAGVFYGCSSLTSLDVSNFNTEKVTTMNSMFNGCMFLESLDLSNFDTSSVLDMGSMFSGCNRITEINLSSFNTENVNNMHNMFNNCLLLSELSLGNFNTAAVNDMSSMFKKCEKLTSLNIENFVTSAVNNMNSMFYGCKSLNEINLSSFDTAAVTDMAFMFSGCTLITGINLSSFNTEKVTTMEGMFYECSNLKSAILTNFITDSLINMKSMFYKCNAITSIDLSSFNTEGVTDMNSLFYDCSSLTSIDVSNFNTSNVSNMGYLFRGCSSLAKLDIKHFDTKNVTVMSYMFYACSSLPTLDLTNFDTSNVSNMTAMFRGCEGLNSLNVSSFDTGKVTNISYMFYGCGGLTELDISNFNTERMTIMNDTFNACKGLTRLSLTNFNTSKVTTMKNMFYECSSLVYLDVSSFNTSNVTSLQGTFSGCAALSTLNISHFNTINVTNMNGLFNNCRSLKSLDISNFNTDKVTDMGSMFSGCSFNVVFTNRSNSKLTKVNAMFNVFYGSSIDLSNFSLLNSTNNENFITVAPNLTNFVAPSNINKHITISASNLSVDSLMSIIDNLMTVNITQTLTIGPANLAKLSDEQIAVAINKNWSIS
jgi:surface protein